MAFTIFLNIITLRAGAIASAANIAPALAVSIYDNYIKGDLKSVMEAQEKLSTLRKVLNLSPYPGAIKEATSIMEIDCGDPIKPIDKPSNNNIETISTVMKDLGLIEWREELWRAAW